MDDLLLTQLFNVVAREQVITWDSLVKTMTDTYGRTRDETYAGMTELINEGKVVVPKDSVYCLPGTFKKIQKQEQENKAWERAFPNGKKLSRNEFDQLTPQEKMDFAINGGQITGYRPRETQ